MWAYYVTEDISTPMDLKYFEILPKTVDLNGVTVHGPAISVIDSYGQLMQGPITLPAKDKDGNDILFIDKFSTINRVTELHVENNANYIAVLDNAFSMLHMDPKLKKIKLPETITYLGNYAFAYCLELEEINLNNNITYIGDGCFRNESSSYGIPLLKVNISKLPDNLEYIGDYAFFGAGPNVTISTIPNKVAVIPASCFAYCANLRINKFGGEGSSLTTIGNAAFRSSGASDITSITFESPVTTVTSSRLFQNGYPNVTNIYTHSLFDFANSGSSDSDSIAQWETALWYNDSTAPARITTHYNSITG
jgi:hypothetical protein